MSFKVKQYEFTSLNETTTTFELDEDEFSLLIRRDGDWEIVAVYEYEDIDELINLLDYIKTEHNG